MVAQTPGENTGPRPRRSYDEDRLGWSLFDLVSFFHVLPLFVTWLMRYAPFGVSKSYRLPRTADREKQL